MRATEVVDKLDGAKQHGSYWMAQCPAHRDGTPSLSVSEGDDGRVLMNCHAGCNVAAVAAAIGLKVSDLFADDKPKTDQPKIIAEYDYRDADGELVMQVIRLSPKDFRQRRPDGKGGWIWKTSEVSKVLYRLPDVIAAIGRGDPIFVTEGEKDADTIAGLGLVATTFVGGAGKHHLTRGGAELLAKASLVSVIADNDPAGHDHARKVAEDVTSRGGTAKTYVMAKGKDVTDALVIHGLKFEDLDTFIPLEQADPPADEPAAENGAGISWRPVDLAAAIDAPPVEPSVLARTDGMNLMYGGRVNWFQGEPETGKSMILQWVAAQKILDGERVLIIDFDSDEHDVIPRLIAMGPNRQQVLHLCDYIRPAEPILDAKNRVTPGLVELDALIETNEYSFVMIDGVTDALALENIDISDNGGVARWITVLAKRCAERTGAAVGVVDHVTKSSENRGRYSIGAQSKLMAVNGATYSVEMITPPGRALLGEPVAGQLRLTLQKDRGGYLRGRLRDKPAVAAVITVTAYPDGGIICTVEAPTDSAVVDDLKLQGRIFEYLAVYDAASKNSITESVTGKAEDIRIQVTKMIDRGWVRVEKKGQSHLHYLTDEGRAEWSL
jgi:hypothetical protein